MTDLLKSLGKDTHPDFVEKVEEFLQLHTNMQLVELNVSNLYQNGPKIMTAYFSSNKGYFAILTGEVRNELCKIDEICFISSLDLKVLNKAAGIRG